jgi:hypothetical protein
MVQFTCSQPRLGHALLLYKRHDLSCQLSTVGDAPDIPVISLPVFPEQTTAKAYAFLPFFTEGLDCPGGKFFRISMLYSFSARSIIISKMIALESEI